MRDLVGKTAAAGDYIIYFVRKDEIQVRYGRVIDIHLNADNDIRMRVRSVTKTYTGGYRRLGIVSLTERATFLVIDDVSQELYTLLA
jgi:hypothetical protein